MSEGQIEVNETEQVDAIQDTLYPEKTEEVIEEVKQEVKQEPEAKAPEKYELKLPEKTSLDKNWVERIAGYAKERGLSNDEAQALLDMQAESVDKYVEGAIAMNQKQVNEFRKMSESDPEFGGEKLNESVQLANSALKRFGGEELINLLDKSGYGNHPEVIRAFYRIGKAMSNDKLVLSGTPPAQSKKIEDVFYGNTNKN